MITLASIKAAGRALFGAPAAASPPAAAAGRFAPTGPRSGAAYETAKASPRRGAVPGPSPTDARNELPQYTRLELLRRSRYHAKNSGLVRQIHQDMRLYSVGEGLLGRATGGTPEWNAKAQAIWDDFCAYPDITGRFTFAEIQDLVCAQLDKDGEIFALKVRDPKYAYPQLQLIRTHRCWSGPDAPEGFVDGIRTDPMGRPVMYRFERDDGTMREVPAPAVLHVYDAEDPDATRYVPPGQHTFNAMQDEREVITMEMHNRKEDARNPRIFKRGPKPPTVASEEEMDVAIGNRVRPSDVPAGTDPETVAKVLGGETLVIENEEDVKPYTSNSPSTEFMSFMGWIHRDSTGGLLPFEFVHDPSKVSGGAVRLVTGKASRVFSHRCAVLERRLCRPVFAWVIANAIAEGELDPNPTWYKSSWTRPPSVTVDAGRDRKADRDDLITGNRTFTEDFGEWGQQFETQMELRAQEIRKILDLEAKYRLPPGMLWNPAPNSTPPTPEEPDDPPNDGSKH